MARLGHSSSKEIGESDAQSALSRKFRVGAKKQQVRELAEVMFVKVAPEVKSISIRLAATVAARLWQNYRPAGWSGVTFRCRN